jgi:hypothetical protein
MSFAPCCETRLSFRERDRRYSTEMDKRSIALIGFCCVIATAATANAFTITGVSASPRTTVVGTPVTVTVTGTKPCGAAQINYADGTDITYPLSGLPMTQTHVYDKPGTYTITARGMGNCDGEATTSVTVSAPTPLPLPAGGEITGVEMAPTPGRIREPVTITVNGSGSCAYEVHFGDGQAREVTGDFPRQFRHTYANANRYTVIVKPNPPCRGQFTQVLQVVDSATQPGRITQIVLSPTPGVAGQPMNITVEGSGACSGYTLDYGDGNLEPRAATLPDRARHVYPAPGRYVISVIANAPCTGQARSAVEVRIASAPGAPHIAKVLVSPTPADRGRAVTITIEGTGACQGYTLDYGDGTSDERRATLPDRVQHVYRVQGRYMIEAVANGSCTGTADTSVLIR